MAEQSVSLNPGESRVVSFEAIPHEARTYQVVVDGLSGSFVAIAPVGLIGDLNDDGVVNALDLTLLERYIAGLSVSTPLSQEEFLRRADVNGDGVVNSLDITALELLIAGGEPPPPSNIGLITLYGTGVPPHSGAPWPTEWTVGWYYADQDKFIRHVEFYSPVGFETPWKNITDPCTPPEPIDLNNLLVKIETYAEEEICPLTGYLGACMWPVYGPFTVENGGVYTIDVTTGVLS